MDVTRDPDTYVPHMMNAPFKRFLRNMKDPQLVEDMGFVGDDLLEGSQYLEKSRKLKPDVVGQPTDIDLAGRTITLTDGTVEELNSELKRVFPEFKGQAYMDDPVKIGEAYISSVARQAGRDKAMDALAESSNPLVREVTGELLESVKVRNEWGRQNPIAEMVRKGFTKGQRVAPVQPKGDMPTTPFDDMLAMTKHKKESKAQRDLIQGKEGKQFISDIGKDTAATRKGLAEKLKDLRTSLMKGLKKKETDATSQIKAINNSMKALNDEIKAVGNLTTENLDDVVGLQTTVEAATASTKAEIKKIRDRYGKAIPRDQARIEKELGKVLKGLDDQAKELEAKYLNGTREVKAEAAERREALERPVREATEELERAKAEVGPSPISKERIQAANVTVRTSFASEDAFEAQRQLYFDALNVLRQNNIPITRTIGGRMTPETADAVHRAVAEMRKLEPPTVTAATAPPAPTPTAAAVGPSPATPTAAPAHEVLQPRDPARGRIMDANDRVAEAAKQLGKLPRSVRLLFEENMGTGAHMLPDDAEILRTFQQGSNLPDEIAEEVDALLRGDYPESVSERMIPGMDEAVAEGLVPRAEAVAPAPAEVLPEAAPAACPAVQGTEAQRAKQGLKTTRKMVKDAEFRLAQASTALDEARAAGLDPERIRQFEYTVQQQQGRVKEARQFLADAERRAAAPAPAEVLPEAPADFGAGSPGFPSATTHSAQELREIEQGLRNTHKDAVAFGADDGELNELEQQLDLVEREIKKAEAPAAAPAAAASPPAVKKPDTKLVRVDAGFYATEDNYSTIKTDDGWLVLFNETDDFGTYPTLAEARAEIKAQQAADAAPEYQAAIEETPAPETPAPAEAIPEPPVAATPVPSPEAPVVEPPPLPKPTTKRITRKWATTEGAGGREVEALQGPDKGWTIESYEESIRGGTVAEAKDIPAGETTGRGPRRVYHRAPVQGPRRPRYVALHPTDKGMVSRSFTSAREAKIAVEDMLRRRVKKETLAEYAARVEGQAMQGPTLKATSITNQRGPLPVNVTPEQAAANRARVQSVVNVPPPAPRQVFTPEYEATEAGAWVEELRPPKQATNEPAQQYWVDYDRWKAMEAQAEDASLTQAERNKAKRTARSMGGAFTQKSGKHYNRHAAEAILAEEAAHEAMVKADLKVVAAQQKLDREIARADQQVEAMVYTKHNNPITGEDSYTRLATGSMEGFGEGAEREWRRIEPPEQGEMTMGTRESPPEVERRRQNYTPEQRAADREFIEGEENAATWMPDTRKEYNALSRQADYITQQLDNSARNQDELVRLQKAVDAEYTDTVKAADDVVTEAKKREIHLKPHENSLPGAQQAYDEAKRVTKEAVDAQTAARQKWMEADKALKTKLAEREEYMKVRAERARAEQRIFHYREGKVGTRIVENVYDGKPQLKGDLDSEGTKLVQRLQKAILDVEDWDRAGYTYLTDNEMRLLTGQQVAIDTQRRALVEMIAPAKVKQAADVLPIPGRDPRFFNDKVFGDKPPPTVVPPMTGTGRDALDRAGLRRVIGADRAGAAAHDVVAR